MHEKKQKPSKASAPAPVTTPKENNKKVFLDIEQKFAEPAGSGFTPKDDRERKGGRKPFGDRNSSSNNNNTAGPKGGANSNKGGPRGPSGPKTTLNVADNVAFPSLGSK